MTINGLKGVIFLGSKRWGRKEFIREDKIRAGMDGPGREPGPGWDPEAGFPPGSGLFLAGIDHAPAGAYVVSAQSLCLGTEFLLLHNTQKGLDALLKKGLLVDQ